MAQILFRFTLSNDTYGVKQISEPDGWNKIKIILERDKEFHSVVEMIETPFIFYKSNGVHDGGMDYLDQMKLNDQVTISIEASEDEGTSWDEFFSGLIDIQSKQRIDSRKVQYVITRGTLFTKFKSRYDISVDIQSTTDLDGNSITPTQNINLSLPSQKIRYYGNYEMVEGAFYLETSEHGMQIDWEKIIVDDIQKFSIPKSIFTPTPPLETIIGNFEAPYDGLFSISVKIVSATGGIVSAWTAASSDFELRVKKTNSEIYSTGTNTVDSSSGTGTYLITTYAADILMVKGEQISIYGVGADVFSRTIFGTLRLQWVPTVSLATTGQITLSGEQIIDGSLTSTSNVLVKDQGDPTENGIYVTSAGAWSRRSDSNSPSELNNEAVKVTSGTINANTYWRQSETISVLGSDPIRWVTTPYTGESDLFPYDGLTVENYLRISADTTFEKTLSEGFFLHDVGFGILDRIIGEGSFYSEYLGSQSTLSRQYDTDGCGWLLTLIRGLQLRQYTLSQKPFSISFKNWWDGVNPIANLGLGYETIDGVDVIEVEEKAAFYDEDPILTLSWVNNIVESFDKDYIFNKIKIGYKKWQSEDISGIDDPQTSHEYSTLFETVGKSIDIESDFIAASLAIEATRRTINQKSADYKFDNDTFIIVINPEPLSSPAGDYQPELDENFDSITNLLNSETRYNSTLTPARNLARWGNYLIGCLQDYLSSSIKFNKGEGNFDMIGDYSGSAPGICFNLISDSLSEKGDLSLSAYAGGLGHLFTPCIWEFSFPLSYTNYKLLRDNRKRAIAVSESDSGHTICFIKRVEYDIIKSRATFTVWKK